MLKEGNIAPDFILKDSNGNDVRLSQFRGKRVILYFYPKDSTPGCTKEACSFRDNKTELDKTNAVILGIRKDSEESHRKFINKNSLNFTLLSDTEGSVIQSYGAWGEKKLYGKSYMGIIRSTFVIDEDGIIEKVYDKVKVATHATDILKELKWCYPNKWELRTYTYWWGRKVFENKELLSEIEEARLSPKKTDSFIDKYTPFIRSEVLKHGIKSQYLDKSDELSIAMFAFYETMQNYDRKKGSFFPLAKVYIHNRLVDYYRKSFDKNIVSLDERLHEDEDKSLLDTLTDDSNHVELSFDRECTKEEINEFKKTLSEYNLTLSDIADNSPKQNRTMDICLKALEYAKEHREILDILVETKKLPLSILTKKGGFDRKTLERHRKYLVGIFLAFTNGFVIIRGHLCQMKRESLWKIASI